MLGMSGMFGTYEQRVVDNFTKGELIVDTAAVTDSLQPYETGVRHPKYNDGQWVIVEMYDTKKEAQSGHKRWVEKMTTEPLPEFLLDVSTSEIANLIDIVGGDKSWRKRK